MLYIHADVVLVTHKSHLCITLADFSTHALFSTSFFHSRSKTFITKRTLAEAAPEPAFAAMDPAVRITRHQVERPASSLASYQVGYVNKLLPYAVNAARGITFSAYPHTQRLHPLLYVLRQRELANIQLGIV
jgi:hypothetical protein